ncbi:MAG: hypothetical protein ACRENA_05905 [Vulcanimicrobiaceae bacterium]
MDGMTVARSLGYSRAVAVAFAVLLSAAAGLHGDAALATDDVPCGSPVFYGMHAEYNPKDGSFNDTIRVILDTVNGLRLWGDFGYPWYYASEASDPFSRHSKISFDMPVRAQLPPPGFDVSKESSAVQLTLKYTLQNGSTEFKPCPQATVRGPSVSEILRVPARIFK